MEIFNKLIVSKIITSHGQIVISRTLIITANSNNLDFISILLLAGGLNATAKKVMVSVDF